MVNRIWIRCEADSEIGMGHWMRCRNLALAFRKLGIEVGFILPANADYCSEWDVHPLPVSTSLREEVKYYPCDQMDAVVLDISSSRTLSQSDALSSIVHQLRRENILTFLIDGLGDCGYTASASAPPHVVLTPYLLARDEPRRNCENWLHGASYAMLASEYGEELEPRQSSEILFSLGGADPWRLTETTLVSFSEGLLGLPEGWTLTVVTGPFFSALRCQNIRDITGSLGVKYCNLHSPNMLEAYRASSAAILGPGLSKYEATACRLRPIILCPREVDRAINLPFLDEGLVVELVSCQDGQPQIAKLQTAINKAVAGGRLEGRRSVDGKGCDRVANQVLLMLGEHSIGN